MSKQLFCTEKSKLPNENAENADLADHRRAEYLDNPQKICGNQWCPRHLRSNLELLNLRIMKDKDVGKD